MQASKTIEAFHIVHQQHQNCLGQHEDMHGAAPEKAAMHEESMHIVQLSDCNVAVDMGSGMSAWTAHVILLADLAATVRKKAVKPHSDRHVRQAMVIAAVI